MTLAFAKPFGSAKGALAPKGLSVSVRISRIAARVTSGGLEPAPYTPKPPAFDTAATMFGKATLPIPALSIGYLMPNSSVTDVFIILSPLTPGQAPVAIVGS
ncbi:hypothetical protein D9M68_931800 [compost metagenome]